MWTFLPTRSLSPAFLQLDIKNTEENKAPRTSTKNIYIYTSHMHSGINKLHMIQKGVTFQFWCLHRFIALPTSRNPPVSCSSTGQLEHGDERLKKKWGHQIWKILRNRFNLHCFKILSVYIYIYHIIYYIYINSHPKVVGRLSLKPSRVPASIPGATVILKLSKIRIAWQVSYNLTYTNSSCNKET